MLKAGISADSPTIDAKTALHARLLPVLAEASVYFSHATVVDRLDELDLELPDDTLRSYLSDAMRTGVIFDAGRGWYSRLAELFVLDIKPIAPLLKQVRKDFPLLDVSAWSTAQINAYAQHLLSTHTTVLYADSDALPSLAEKLEDRGWKVYLNPTPKRSRGSASALPTRPWRRARPCPNSQKPRTEPPQSKKYWWTCWSKPPGCT